MVRAYGMTQGPGLTRRLAAGSEVREAGSAPVPVVGAGGPYTSTERVHCAQRPVHRNSASQRPALRIASLISTASA